MLRAHGFKDKQAKDLTWQSIDAILVPSCPGFNYFNFVQCKFVIVL